jgi:hypothetical protein
MSSHPINLAFRFFLELAALAAMALWGFHHGGLLRHALAIGAPLLAAALWGIFAVPGDPSRSGSAPIPVPGAVRLALEAMFFGLATWGLFVIGRRETAAILAIAVMAHYAISHDRVAWLLRR